MGEETSEKHLLAGLDERQRGFTRPVEIDVRAGLFRAVLRYETFVVEAASHENATAALAELVRLLQAQGYRQLRTRLNFLGRTYLGTQEQWVEYADPGVRVERPGGAVGFVLRLWRAMTGRGGD